jgi:hypothetical protein
MRKSGICVLTASVILTASIAVAQDALPGVVVVPWGDWLSAVLVDVRNFILSAAGIVLSFVLTKFWPAGKAFIEAARVEQLLGRAVDFGIAAVAGATKGKTATIPIANEVLERALEYAVDAAPSLATKLAETLRPKLIARIGAAGIVPANAEVGPVPDVVMAPGVVSLMGSSAASPIGFVQGYATLGA